MQEIRLEIGALAAWAPAKKYAITPYVALQYGHLFEQPSTEILTVLPEMAKFIDEQRMVDKGFIEWCFDKQCHNIY